MNTDQDNPGVFFPPPLIYIGTFFLSLWLQDKIPLSDTFFETGLASLLGIIAMAAGLFFMVPALTEFIKTKNTLVTIKPANVLANSGIYTLTRNPMYLGLLLLYIGIAFYHGNFWTLLLVPPLLNLISIFVIGKEEKYLERAFGKNYLDYKRKVRRWL